ncbi:MAG: hypothetical protein ABL998_00605 [Planctomycetota bacterium]
MGSRVSVEGRVIQLDASRRGGVVTVTPEDENRFNLRVEEAIAACQKWVDDRQARRRFDLLLTRLQDWVLQRGDLRDAYLTMRDGGFVFLTVRKEATYDAKFEDELTTLDVELAHDQDLRCEVDVLAMPPASDAALQSFLSPGLTLRFKSGQG